MFSAEEYSLSKFSKNVRSKVVPHEISDIPHRHALKSGRLVALFRLFQAAPLLVLLPNCKRKKL